MKTHLRFLSRRRSQNDIGFVGYSCDCGDVCRSSIEVEQIDMGLGPHNSSLLDRTGHPAKVWRDPFAMRLEQQDRREARQLKAIWHAQHRAQPRKPEAPAHSPGKEFREGSEKKVRVWIWDGEDIPSKNLFKGETYLPATLRKAGFKLPKLKGR